MAAPAKTARERILDVAADLFYREGIRAVGVDEIIAKAGCGKMSLYRSFASKDELVVAFLERFETSYWERWDRAVARHPGDPRGQLDAVFDLIRSRVLRPEYRGCPFANTATEFPDPGHPGRLLSAANKAQLRTRLRVLCDAVGARTPDRLADQLMLLIEGAYATSLVFADDRPAQALVEAAQTLIDAAVD